MFDISWAHLALIAAVALVVIGPKDLPRALRTAGTWVRKARAISREFQNSVEQMVREAELDEVKKEIESASRLDIGKHIEKTIDPQGELAEALRPPEMPRLDSPVIGADVPKPEPGLAKPPAPTEPPPPASPPPERH